MNNNLNKDQLRKQSVSKLKTLTSTKRQWDAFWDYLDILISEQHTKLEKSESLVAVHRAQGAIDILRYLKYLKDEASE